MDILNVISKITNKSSKNIEILHNYIFEWKEWYSGNVKRFHNYRVYNGKNYLNMKRLSLNMPKRICEDWANLLCNEKTDITLSDETTQKILERVLKDCNFWSIANGGIEKTFALGRGAFCVVVDNLLADEDGYFVSNENTKVKVKFFNAENIYPITIRDDEVVECAFVSVDSDKINLSIHLLNEQGNYEIHSLSSSDSKTFDMQEIQVFETGTDKAWFSVFKPNIENNIDMNNPLGISIFANAIDILKSIDVIYDSFANEFILGKKRIFVNTPLQRIETTTGEEVQVFDANDVVIYQLPESDDGTQMINDNTQTLRIADHISGLQQQLNLLSSACGLGTEHYKYDNGGISTATQIISENSDMFRAIKKHEIIIEQTLIKITQAVLFAINNFTTESVNENVEITIKFDDSIIEDKTTERQQDRLDVTMGVMSKIEYREKYYNEDKITATRAIEDMSTQIINDEE